MKILNRYIFQESAVFFGVALLAFTSILLTVRMLKFAALVINKGVELSQIGWIFLAIIPTFLESALPMATLLGVMMAFARLSGDSELIVIRANGINLSSLVKPVLVFGALVTIVNLYVSQVMKPWGYRTLSAQLFDIARGRATAGLTEGVFNPLGKITLYAEGIDDSSGALTRVLIDDRRDKLARKVIVAQRGRVVADAASKTITLMLYDGDIHETIRTKYAITSFTTNSLVMNSSELFTEETDKKDKPIKEMETSELVGWIGDFEGQLRTPASDPSDPAETKQRKMVSNRLAKMKTELTQRFSMPLASFVLALVAVPLGVLPPRTQKTWGAGMSLALGMGMFILYFGLLSLAVGLADSGKLSPYIGLCLPNLASLLLGALLLHKVSSEQWASVPDRLAQLVRRARRAA